MDVKKALEECRENALSRKRHIERQEILMRIKERRSNLGLNLDSVNRDLALEDKVINSLDIAYEKAVKILSHLSGVEYDVLFLYYVEGLKWDKIATRLYWSIRSVYNARNRAFSKLKDIYGEE